MSGNLSISELKKRLSNGDSRFLSFIKILNQKVEFFEDFKNQKFKIKKLILIYKDKSKHEIDFNSTINDTSLSNIESDFFQKDVKNLKIETESGFKIYTSNIKKPAFLGGRKPYIRQTDTIQTLNKIKSLKYNKIVIRETFGKDIYVFRGKVTPYEMGNNSHADFKLVCEDAKVLYISHKHGAGLGSIAEEFQYYSGITKYNADPDVKKFINDIIGKVYKTDSNLPLQYPKKVSYFRKIKDQNLALKALYGHEYGKEITTENNVDCIAQGKPKLSLVADVLTIEFEKIFKNGSIPEGEYEPVFYCRFASDRGLTNPILKFARFIIAPRNYRTYSLELNDSFENESLTERYINFNK